MNCIDDENYLYSSCNTVGALAPTIPEDKDKMPNNEKDLFKKNMVKMVTCYKDFQCSTVY